MSESRNTNKTGHEEMAVHHTSYDPDYFEPLASAEERHFWFRSRNRLISSLLKKIKQEFPEPSHLLEIGCGTGNVLRAITDVFRDRSMIGMDLFHNGLVYAKKKLSCPLVQGDLHQAPFSQQFGLIGLFDVLEHMQDDARVLDEINKMLKTGGYIILTVPAFSALWSYFDVAGHHVRRYQQDDLNRNLETAGFEVVQSSYFMSLLFPIVWVRRKLAGGNALNGNDQDSVFNTAVEELKIVPLLNEILEWILGLETFFISRGFQFPFGTSLIAIAKKKNPVDP
jgi:SAM-dependent methyltransferase